MKTPLAFTADNKYFRISFKHERFYSGPERISMPEPTRPANAESYHGDQPATLSGRTICSIRSWPINADPAQFTVVGRGVAECSSADVYDKETGRQLALKRAIANAWPHPNEFWRLAYEAYANRTKVSKQEKQAA